VEMLYFLEKAGKIKPPLTSGGWGLCPQTPKLLFPLNSHVFLSTAQIS